MSLSHIITEHILNFNINTIGSIYENNCTLILPDDAKILRCGYIDNNIKIWVNHIKSDVYKKIDKKFYVFKTNEEIPEDLYVKLTYIETIRTPIAFANILHIYLDTTEMFETTQKLQQQLDDSLYHKYNNIYFP